MAPHTPKRVRTGCLKCRVRRRKCDEGKPRCQRCIAGGFECRYGTRLSFLDKNVMTARGGRSPESRSPTYRTVQFVTAEPIDQTSHSGTERQVPTPSLSAAQVTRESPGIGLASVSTTQEPANTDPARCAITPPAFEQPIQAVPPSTSSQHDDSWPTGLSPEGGYETALHALLSLGGDKNGTPTEERRTPRAPATLGGPRVAGINTHTAPGNHGYSIPEIAGTNSLQLVTDDLGLSESQVLGLLRYYRYEVAPWLDICDLSQTFGNLVSCLTAASASVLLSVVNLAASITRETGGQNWTNTDGYTPPGCTSSTSRHSQVDFSTRILCRVLADSKSILIDELGTSACQGIDEFVEIFGSPPLSFAVHPLDITMYYLILRFDLSYALSTHQPLKLPLWPPDEFPFSAQGSELAAQVFRSASRILVLCAQTANLAFGGHDAQGGSRVDQWASLLDSVCSWYTDRFQTFKPMVEADGTGDDFPLVLFTSGAALMANQLYHTAMLLLLQNKPRTFKAGRSRVSSTMSALWHARMICGITMGNEARECWDPSLVASFVLAARGMTHWDQQRRLLSKLDDVGRLTGWKMGGYQKYMAQEWGV